ncbi:MAG TPA: biotin carboxylase N-terminal domain-containing protein, partial [Ramlibacter sp.]|nr:biotin carboxylase N-terminal domain-containing protein [Ramlibacter sp.]
MFHRVLVANRGEIALRIVRAVRDIGAQSVAVYAQDDAHAPHVALADEAVALAASGPPAYLDGRALAEIAKQTRCDAVHPGYGFLSERADFAQQCEKAGVTFIGPDAQHLELFGDKARARALAKLCDVPVLPGSEGAVTLDQARDFFQAQPGAGIMLKAIGGGGGRGMRAVTSESQLDEAYARCASEARAFGVAGVYAERLMPNARHIEVQVIGDGQHMMSLGERECTLQRRFQKLVEIAPSPSLSNSMREQLVHAALKMAREVWYPGLCTFEFLVGDSAGLPFVFIEANPRLQVEHTVTEEVTGLDLVQLQIALAAGESLESLGLDPAHAPKALGFAIQWRVNAETLDAQGNARPAGGVLSRFDLPSGPGVRVDTHGVAGAQPSPHYDTLLAKVIVHSRSADFADAARKSRRVLSEMHIEGPATNLPLLRAVAARAEFDNQSVHTRWLEDELAALLADSERFADASQASTPRDEDVGDGLVAVRAPMAARLVQANAQPGELVAGGAPIAVLEAMKMEHVLHAQAAGR